MFAVFMSPAVSLMRTKMFREAKLLTLCIQIINYGTKTESKFSFTPKSWSHIDSVLLTNEDSSPGGFIKT